MSIIQASDFSSGQYGIPQDKFTLLAPYIAKYEREYLLHLLGSELYDLFIADLTAPTPQIPQAAIYLAIFNKFNITSGGIWYQGEGIKEMLKQFIYFHWMRDAVYRKTTFGVTKSKAETGENNGYLGFNLEESYNHGVNNINSIQLYITDNMVNYPTFRGNFIDFISGI